ncbi:unnamed protein product [Phaedon cochleariae]|uniref:Odorant receptor n=1 Tax=Phaedon cochleariae TaxID=80249 RepID=A0A9P0GMG8_PHACE|nr:unnamed protein product [Phaedon cochleariae]
METIEHLVVRFEHVGDVFVAAAAEKNPLLRREKIHAAIRYHKAVIEMGKLLNKCFSPCMVVHISLTGPVLGVAGFRFLTSTSVSDVIYSMDWYNLEKDLQRDLMIVMMRCQKPVLVRAGPFGTMRYSTIVTILKTSYSYITLLKQTM